MKTKYNLNLKLYECAVILANIARFQGLIALEIEVKELIKDFDVKLQEYIMYGLGLVCNGVEPSYVEFLLEEEYRGLEKQLLDQNELLDHMRFMKFIISKVQKGEGDTIEILLNSLEDIQVRSQYKNWMMINQFDHKITFENSKSLSNEDIIKIMNSNPMVKKYYDEMFGKR